MFIMPHSQHLVSVLTAKGFDPSRLYFTLPLDSSYRIRARHLAHTLLYTFPSLCYANVGPNKKRLCHMEPMCTGFYYRTRIRPDTDTGSLRLFTCPSFSKPDWLDTDWDANVQNESLSSNSFVMSFPGNCPVLSKHDLFIRFIHRLNIQIHDRLWLDVLV